MENAYAVIDCYNNKPVAYFDVRSEAEEDAEERSYFDHSEWLTKDAQRYHVESVLTRF